MKRSNARPALPVLHLCALLAAGLFLCPGLCGQREARAQHAAAPSPAGGTLALAPQPAALPAGISSAPAVPASSLLLPIKVAHSAQHLSIDSDNTTLHEALLAISHATGMQIESSYDSPEHFPVHYSGTEQQVLNALLGDSDCGFIIMTSSTDPAAVRKVVISRLELVDSLGSQRAETHTSLDTRMERVAMYVPPESVAERRGETVLDIRKPAPSEDSTPDEADLQPVLPALPPAPAETSAQSTPAPAVGDDKPADDQKVSASGRYMQELYKARLQQQKNPATAPSP